MTGETIQQLNTYFSNNYGRLVNLSKKLDNDIRTNNVVHNQYKDGLSDTYLKCNKRFHKPFSGSVEGYVVTVLKHTLIDYNKKNKLFHSLDGNEELINKILSDHHEDVVSTNLYQDQIQELTKEIFKYLSSRYTEQEISITRIYMTTKSSTYLKIANMTGYSKSYVGEIVSRIKVDLRNNFIDYMKNKQ